MDADGEVERESQGTRVESIGIILSMAMLMALLYVAEVGWKRFVTVTFVAASRDVIWMAPLSAAFFSLLLLAPIWLIAPRLSRARARAAAVFGASWLVAFAVLLPWTQVHRGAAVILAAGVGTLAVRLLGTGARVSALRKAGLVMASVLTVGAVFVAGRGGWRARQGYASLSTARAGAPNVLFILLDTVRASALGLYGYGRATSPEIDRFATGGIVFDRAISTAPWTLPSHATLFTGEYPGLLSVSFRSPLDAQQATLAEHFRDAGYETVGFTGNLHYTAWDSGLSRGFLRWDDFMRSTTQTLRSGWIGQSVFVLQLMHARARWQVGEALRHPKFRVVPKPGGEERIAEALVTDLLAWHRDRPSRPYFAFVNFFDAHEDYRPPTALRTRFANKPNRRDLYDAEVFYLDRELGRLWRELGRRGALDNTIVVITADHGEQFGEHKMSGHGNSLYMQLLRVPLILRFDRGIPAGTRSADIISLRDIGATLLELAGVRPQVPFPGQSLSPLWTGDSTGAMGRSEAISELTQDAPPPTSDPLSRSQGVSIAIDGAHLIHRNAKDAKPELYDTVRDIDETKNLAESAEGKVMADERRAVLRDLLVRDKARFERTQPAAPPRP